MSPARLPREGSPTPGFLARQSKQTRGNDNKRTETDLLQKILLPKDE